MKELDIEKLEDAEFTFGKEAFRAKSLHCDKCYKRMKKIAREMGMPNSPLSVKLNVFRCIKCKKEYLNFEEGRKLDRALILSRLFSELSHYTVIRRSLSFDGDNYIFRIPADMARSLSKNPHVDMIRLSSRDLLIHLDKS